MNKEASHKARLFVHSQSIAIKRHGGDTSWRSHSPPPDYRLHDGMGTSESNEVPGLDLSRPRQSAILLMRMQRKQHASSTLGPPLKAAKKAVQAYLNALSTGSRRTVAQSLDMVAVALLDHDEATREHIAWHQLDPDALVKAREELAQSYEPATVNKMLSCVRGVIRACVKLGYMNEAAAERLCAIPNVPMIYHPPDESIRLVTAPEVKSIFEVCRDDRSAAGRRDAALLAILLATGLRRAEAVALDLEDYSISSRTLHVRSADPAKTRSVAIKARACRLIDAWLNEREGEPGPLLLPVNKSGVIMHRQLTDQAIYDIIRRLAVRADVPHITTRAIRRTFVAALIARGLPLEHVQQLIGHASWVTTESYRQLADELRARSVELPQLFLDVKRSIQTQSATARGR